MKSISSYFAVFNSRKMVAILLLGFASGLPYALADDAFRAWLTKTGFDIKTIGWLSLVGLPYSLKFLWSPLIDYFRLPVLGRRRGWILATQIGLIIAILGLASQMGVIAGLDPAGRNNALQLVAITAVAIAFLSATQDIAVDAYRTDVVSTLEVGAGASVALLGYRVALLLTGWIAFVLADRIGWASVYGVMALFLGIGIVGSFIAPNEKANITPPNIGEAVIQPFLEFFRRLGTQQAILVLIFIVVFRLGDAMVAKMAVSFLGAKGLGFSDTDIGNIRQGMGLIATIVGTLAGGSFLSKLGINRSLWVFGGLQAASNLAYYFLALTGKNLSAMVVAINIENFCSGLAVAGFVGYLMSLCNPEFSATQFALLSSLMAVGRDLIAGPAAGELATKFGAGTGAAGLAGWGGFFLVTLAIAIPGMVMLFFMAPWNANSPEDSMR
ncbi:AmpG family muropeptide MFS transporter [Chamaesiphon sp. VAR_48_metabat_135_sub]|uniref:AmpG family muropeptide MFS transporter n=1 Tax=Chamaesiphon sp. VAR_48_metabat_135_sub TaxID=2964699 RepID=UPI00286AE58C|nr:MFS transporter [Chamaesiphon sp. VAR_48_metabat_135_sub]